MSKQPHTGRMPVNEVKVLDRVIDVYLWISEDLNTAEVQSVGHYLIELANRRATDVELQYRGNRYPQEPPEDYNCTLPF